ncbi:MAG: nitroreductase family protein [Bacillota bacterium]
MQAMETIQKRLSVRAYADTPVSEAVQAKLRALFQEYERGPFGIPARFRLLDLSAVNRAELRRLGTYGVIKGARLYILAAVKEGKRAQEDLGYCLEKIILEATAMGLGTCWLGGTFRRGSFAGQMQLDKGELLPAITPVGYPADQTAFDDRQALCRAGLSRRKPWTELFFLIDGKKPLSEAEAGEYRAVLEAVRLAPSASNRQPWRLLKDQAGLFHLYLKEDRLYNRILGKIRIQNIDMGIAMCHFALAAKQLGLTGRWTPAAAPRGGGPGREYLATRTPDL